MSDLLVEQNSIVAPEADLVSLRYLFGKTSPKNIREDVGHLIYGEPLSEPAFERIRSTLLEDGTLERRPRKTFGLTDSGRSRALRFLGTTELPSNLNWNSAISRFLIPQATGLSTEAVSELKSKDHWAAFTLKQKYGLRISNHSSVRSALEALVCTELGYPELKSLKGLLETVLSKLVGSEQILKEAELLTLLPTYQTDLKKADAKEIQLKFVRDWLTNRAQSIPIEDPEPFDLTAFASTCLALAANSPAEARFHDNKVFIASLWRMTEREPGFPRVTLAEFKQRLIDANSQNLLRLSRADFVQAMNPQQVADSETSHLNATFHFVLLPEAHS